MIIKFNITNFGPIRETQTLDFEAEKSVHLEDYYVRQIAGHRILKAALLFGACKPTGSRTPRQNRKNL